MERKNILITGIVLAELIQGAGGLKEVDVLKGLAEVLPVLEEKPDTWRRAGVLSYELRRKGKTVGLSDCYIAVLAVDYGAELLTLDRHFEVIARHYPLKIADLPVSS